MASWPVVVGMAWRQGLHARSMRPRAETRPQQAQGAEAGLRRGGHRTHEADAFAAFDAQRDTRAAMLCVHQAILDAISGRLTLHCPPRDAHMPRAAPARAPATAIAAAPSAPAGRYLTTQDLDLVRQSLAARMAVETPAQKQQQQKQQQQKREGAAKGEWGGTRGTW